MSVTSTKQQSSPSSSSMAMLRARNASRRREESLQSVMSTSEMKHKTKPKDDNNNIEAGIKEDDVKQEDENESETEIVGAEEHGREENSSSELFTSTSEAESSLSSLSSVMSYNPEENNDDTHNHRNNTKNNKRGQGVEVRRRARKKKQENNISHIDKSHLAHKQYVPGEDIPSSISHTNYDKTTNREKVNHNNNKEEVEMQNTNTAEDSRVNHLHEHNDEADATHTALRYARRFGANVKLSGRVCLSLSKTIRKELKVPSYTLPMVYQSLFHHSLPYFSDICLTAMYFAEDNHTTETSIDSSKYKNKKKKNDKSKDKSVEMKNEYTEHTESYGVELYSQEYAMRTTVFRHLVQRVLAPHRIARHLHHYSRTMEFSRMYGILFNEVITRGSQFQVEATLRRLT